MGQSYTVEAKLIFKNGDPKSFCDIVKQKAQDEWDLIKLKKRQYDFSDPWECFQVITTTDAYEYNGLWICDFDGTYSWESVMYDIFEEAMKVLENGSFVRIAPDLRCYEMLVKDGQIITEDFGEET